MKVVAFDVATSGLPDWKAPDNDLKQPHIVRLSTVTIIPGVRAFGETDDIVRPDGWSIPPETVAIHGVDKATAEAKGRPEGDVVRHFLAAIADADEVVSYGISFDARILRIAMVREGFGEDEIDALKERLKGGCLMRRATDVCYLPPTHAMLARGQRGFKQPTLAEAVRILLNEELPALPRPTYVDAHLAGRLYLAMQEGGAPA